MRTDIRLIEDKELEKNMAGKKVAIIGGGAAGLAAARALSGSGVGVHIIEKTNFLGGHAIGYTCKATDECMQCGACSVEQLLKDVSNDSKISVHLLSEIEKVSYKEGFALTLKKGPVFIDPDKCNNCGVCYEKSPVKGAVLRGYSKNNRPLYALNADKLADCKPLVKLCPKKAIVLDAKSSQKTVKVDAVIVTSGFAPFDPARKGTYGYGKFPNVISGLDMERIKREKGALVRPSDGLPAKKIAFIQCVGSRDERLGNLWCSRVCCPYALRSARSVKHKQPETEITVFYMDIQNIGKEFQMFYEACHDGFRFVRSIPVDVFPADNDDLSIRFYDEDGLAAKPVAVTDAAAQPEEAAPVSTAGKAVYDTFDLLVLSIGITPNPDNLVLADILGVDLDGDGFIKTSGELDATATKKKGIFVAGTAHQPKTIDASIAQATKAAREALKYLGE